MTPETPPQPVRRRSRRLLLVLIALLVIASTASAVIWNLVTPSERPDAVMVFHIERIPRTLLSPRSGDVPDDFEGYRQAQAALVRSRRVLNAALNDPEVKSTELIRAAGHNPLDWLDANLRVSFPESSGHMHVELDGDDEAETVLVLNAIAKSYLEASHQFENGRHVARLAELERNASELNSELQRKQQALNTILDLLASNSFSPRHFRPPEALSQDLKLVSDELRRLRLERALLDADMPPMEEPQLSPQIAVGGGAIIPAGGAPALLPTRDASKLKRELAIREHFWMNELRTVRERLEAYSRYSSEIENLRGEITRKTEMARLLFDEIERCRLELRALPRVTLADEPYVRPRQR